MLNATETGAGRIVYGARCTWWDSITKAGQLPDSGLPCCPHCRGVLFEVPNDVAWWASVAEHDQDNPGYRQLIEWSRGKCFTDWRLCTAAYQAETEQA